MSDSEIKKTKVDFLRDVISQLKEIRHYAQTNTENLSAHWLAFDTGEYEDKALAERINTLLNQQGKLLDETESVIQDLEISVNHSEQES